MTLLEFLTARVDADEAWGRAEECGYQQDPARVLREVEVKRAMLDEHDDDAPTCYWTLDPSAAHGDYGPADCPTLRHLAAVYADHPDYREEWRYTA